MPKIYVDIPNAEREAVSSMSEIQRLLRSNKQTVSLTGRTVYYKVLERRNIKSRIQNVENQIENLCISMSTLSSALSGYLNMYSKTEDNILRWANNISYSNRTLSQNSSLFSIGGDIEKTTKRNLSITASIYKAIINIIKQKPDIANRLIKKYIQSVTGGAVLGEGMISSRLSQKIVDYAIRKSPRISSLISEVLNRLNTPSSIKDNEGKTALYSANELNKKAKDIMDLVAGDYFLDSDRLGFLSGLMGYLSAYTGLVSGVKDEDESILKSALKISDESVDFLKDLYTLVGEKEVSSDLSRFAAILSVFKEFASLPIDDIPEAMKKGGGLISAISNFSKLIYYGNDWSKFSLKEKIGINTDLNMVECFLTMLSYASGDVWQRYLDDGIYDLGDYAMTLLETGIVGGAKFVEGSSFGIVSIDADRAIDIFNYNINTGSQFIDSIGEKVGAPPIAIAIAKIPGSVVVSLISTGEVFVDYGMQIGSWINDVRSALKSKQSGGGFR